MKKLLLLLLFAPAAFGQNGYAYAVIASKFEAQKSAGQYGLNDMARQFMVKYGYQAFLDTEVLPQDAANCKALYIDVLPDNSLLKTKVKLVLKNCRNEIVSSAEGESKEKDYRVSYNQALRDAFQSLAAKGFPKATAGPVETKVPDTREAKPEGYLSVQPVANGYQIIDTTPKIILKILKTSSPDVYIAEGSGHNGVFVRRDGKWQFEYYDNGKPVYQVIDVTLQ